MRFSRSFLVRLSFCLGTWNKLKMYRARGFRVNVFVGSFGLELDVIEQGMNHWCGIGIIWLVLLVSRADVRWSSEERVTEVDGPSTLAVNARLLVWLGSEQVKDKPKIRAFLSLLRGKWSWLANSIWSVSLLGDNRLTVCGLCDKIPGNKMIGNSVEIQRREKGKRAIAAWMWKWEFVENFVRYWLNTLSVKGAVKKESENFSP